MNFDASSVTVLDTFVLTLKQHYVSFCPEDPDKRLSSLRDTCGRRMLRLLRPHVSPVLQRTTAPSMQRDSDMKPQSQSAAALLHKENSHVCLPSPSCWRVTVLHGFPFLHFKNERWHLLLDKSEKICFSGVIFPSAGERSHAGKSIMTWPSSSPVSGWLTDPRINNDFPQTWINVWENYTDKYLNRR